MPAPVSEPEPEPVSEPEPVPASGPATATVTVKVGNDNAVAVLRILDGQGAVVAEPAVGEAFTVPAGTYRIVATIADASVLADTPELTEEVTLVPPEPTTIPIRFALSRVRLRIVRAGRPIRNATADVVAQRSGEAVASFRVTDAHVPISPGRYDAVIRFGREEVRVEGIMFASGATADIPVNLQ
jgi:hypothetical protein